MILALSGPAKNITRDQTESHSDGDGLWHVGCGTWKALSPSTRGVQQCDSVITLASGKAFSTTFSFLKKMPRALLKKLQGLADSAAVF